MDNNSNIFGCFVSSGTANFEDTQIIKDLAKEKGELFRAYIWGNEGIDIALKKLQHENYGKDLVLILFQFYVNPIPYQLAHIKEIESYRKKEKSIGIPIIVTDNNFFNKSEEGRYSFLKQSILQKMDLLGEVVKSKKLDTNIQLLKIDIEKVF
jgi:hypothetical protein